MKKTLAILLAAVLAATALCACLTVSAESSNLAEGKTVTGANPTSGNMYTDKYNGSLVDGNASETFDPDNAPGDWFCFYYNPDLPSNTTHDGTSAIGAFVIDLGAASSVESVRIHMVTDTSMTGSGVKPPQSVKVETSSDNKSWTDFGTTDDFSSYKSIDWVEVKGSAAANAQYVRVTITYEGYTLLLNEVQVIGTVAPAESSDESTSSAASDDSSAADSSATDSSATDSSAADSSATDSSAAETSSAASSATESSTTESSTATSSTTESSSAASSTATSSTASTASTASASSTPVASGSSAAGTSSNPTTGDTGVIVLVVLAVLAVAGTVVAVKVRR